MAGCKNRRRTYSSVRALAKLLQLLERAGVSAVVHGGHDGGDVTVAEVANADRGVGAVGDSESACVDWLQAARGRSRGKLGVPEDGGGGGELAGDSQRG